MIACACGHESRTAELWRKHYDEVKPAEAVHDMAARAQHARTHVPSLAVVSVRNGAKPVIARTAQTPEERLRSIGREIAAHYEAIGLLEAEELRLVHTLEPLPPFKPKWYRVTAVVACLTCGRETRDRLSGVPRCKNDIHRADIATSRDSKNVPDSVWAIIVDEEVDDNG